MRNEAWFNPQEASLYGYEACVAAKHFIGDNQDRVQARTAEPEKLSVAEFYYILHHPWAGLATVFLSHAQLETLRQTLAALFLYEASHPGHTYFVDIFSIRQGVSGDFKVDKVEEIIKDMGRTALVVHPCLSPETMKRIWCVFEVYATIAGEAF